MKRKSLAGVVALIVAMPSVAFASSTDELWSPPQVFTAGYHAVIMNGDYDANTSQSPLLSAFDSTGAENICSKVGDPACLPAQGYNFRTILPACSSPAQLDCVASLTAIAADGSSDEGIFSSYTYSKHPNWYPGDASLGIPQTETPGIWNLTKTPHDAGTQYVVNVHYFGNVYLDHPSTGKPDNATLVAEVVPVTRADSIRDASGKSNTCENTTRTNNGRAHGIGCEGPDQIAPGQPGQCAFQLQAGGCLVRHGFPANTKFKVVIRLTHEPDAWLDGRVSYPTMTITPSGAGTTVSVEGEPMKVPTFYIGADYAALPKIAQDYWTTCLAKLECGFTTVGDNVGTPHLQPNPELRNVQDSFIGIGDQDIATLKTLLPAVGDKSVAVRSIWNYRTLDPNEMRKANGCFSNGPGVKGIVTTNSTAYSEGPPALVNGSLNYVVASPHFNPDGTVFKGNYNLVMRSDVARCLYHFTSAPINATVSVTSADGQPEIATTVVSEKGGWLSLAANNFEFSAPTVQVKLTQQGSASGASKSTTITCVKGKVSKIVKAATCPVGYKKK
jgi:hypothetical protein